MTVQGNLTRTRVHGGNPWELIRRDGFSKDDILDFSVDVNPLGFPAAVRSTILEHLDDIRCYPDPDAQELRDAIAAHHRIPVETILPGNGAAELISLLARCRHVKRALIVVPTFGEYEWAVEQAGATPVLVQTAEADGFRLDVAHGDWAQGVQDVELAFLCNPNNPTGVVAPKDEIFEIAHRCRETGTLLVVDEAFVEFVEQPTEVSVIPDAMHLGNVVVLRSLTKFFAIPGLRLGYLVASSAVVEDLRALQSPWPLNTFALAVGVQLFRELDDTDRSRRAVATLRDEVCRSLCAIPGLEPFPSVTNFILCKLTTSELTSSALSERLAHQGILIRNCDSFTGLESGRFIRIAVRTQEDNARLVAALRELLTPCLLKRS